MKKDYILEELDCAVCAAKIESEVAKLDGVNQCSVSFLTKRMVLDADENRFPDIQKRMKKLIRKVEPDVELIEG